MRSGCHIYIFCAACLALAARAYTVAAPLDNYQAILDRMPFGPPPQSVLVANAATAETKAAVASKAEQEKLAAKIKMSCVNVTPDGGVAVGFTDLSLNPPRDCYLRVGATAHGWTVLDADYDDEWATIEKDGVAITVKLGRGLIGGGAAAASVAQAAPAGSAASAVPAETAEPAEPLEPAEPPPPMVVQYARLRAIELTGGPPMPNVSLATIPPEKQAELEQERQKIRDLRQRGIGTRSYRERLQAKVIEAEAQRQAEDQEQLADMEEIARAIALEELERRALEQQAAEEAAQ